MDRIDKIKEMMAVSPADSFLQHALALEYIKLGMEADARNLFETILERTGETDAAIKVYERGMEETKKVGDNHAFGELRSAYEELTF